MTYRKRRFAVTDMTVFNGATIAFDLDGTLIESAPDLIAALNAILIAEDLKPLTFEDAWPLISRGARWLLQWVSPATGCLSPPLARQHAESPLPAGFFYPVDLFPYVTAVSSLRDSTQPGASSIYLSPGALAQALKLSDRPLGAPSLLPLPIVIRPG